MDIYTNAQRAYLLLEDGTVIKGYSVGAKHDAFGELVFNTSVVGFQQLLTDPANENNLLVDTFPMLGNYGVVENDDDLSAAHARAVIVRDWCPTPSNYKMTGRIDEWMERKDIVGLFGVDTRALTRKIRDYGVQKALITMNEVTEENKASLIDAIKAYEGVAPYWKEKNEMEINSVSERKMVVMDLGARADVVASLNARGFSTIVVPSSMSAEEMLSHDPEAIVICGGYSGKADLSKELETIAELQKSGKAILGIGLGHQLMGILAGGKVEKMKAGHRGANCPVTSLESGRTFVSTQNHGDIVVDVDPAKAEVTHINANDKTCEGLSYKEFKGMSVQFIPECELGRRNFDGVYDAFLGMIEK